MTLKTLIREMEDRRKTVTIFGPDYSYALDDYFDTRHVRVEFELLPTDEYEGFIVVSQGDEFLGSVDLSALDSLASPRIGEIGSREAADANFHYLLELLDDTLFSSFERQQLLAASREFEDRAAREGHGTLYTGFQRLSAMRQQVPTYTELGAVPGLSVVVYGQPDWSPPPISGVTVRRIDDEQIRDVWFVVYDGGDNVLCKCALLAEEVKPGVYYGFWTYDPPLVDRAIECIRGTATDEYVGHDGRGEGDVTEHRHGDPSDGDPNDHESTTWDDRGDRRDPGDRSETP